MLEESFFVPYNTSLLFKSPWLIIAPHPDDEAIGMGGTIILGIQNKIDIYIAFVTNGEIGGDPNVRKKEAERACKSIGIENIFFGILEIEEFFLKKMK